MKKLLIGFSSVVFALIVIAIAGQFGRELVKLHLGSKEDIEIKNIADQYADAGTKVTSKLLQFTTADQEIISSIDQLERLKSLLVEAEDAFIYYELVRKKGAGYLISNKDSFKKEFYDHMFFCLCSESIRKLYQSFIAYSAQKMEHIEYTLLNFIKIMASAEPQITDYINGYNSCEKLRLIYNDAYVKKTNDMKERLGEAEVNRVTKQLLKE